MKMGLICLKMDVLVKPIFIYEWFRTQTRLDTEAKGNSEMAYFIQTQVEPRLKPWSAKINSQIPLLTTTHCCYLTRDDSFRQIPTSFVFYFFSCHIEKRPWERGSSSVLSRASFNTVFTRLKKY